MTARARLTEGLRAASFAALFVAAVPFVLTIAACLACLWGIWLAICWIDGSVSPFGNAYGPLPRQ